MRASHMPPKYKAGDRIRVQKQVRWGHIRTPLFVLGKRGLVDNLRGEYPDPEKLAYGMDGLPPIPLYCIKFDYLEVWGESCPESAKNDKMHIDIYEHWLDTD
ncbi:MAG: nitrile hydratase subunit beta [Nitrospinota bacterium]|jgi:nitrile hydratase|nr:nitrile hydratase subunit beta [Nitrospinota bacterium]